MKISKDTKISAVIKENEEAIEVIASLNKHFRKFRNPFLRKTLGSRVSIREAASIGNVSSELILDKLRIIGFEIDNSVRKTEGRNPVLEKKENNLPENISFELDVREELSKGKDPMKKILKESKKVSPGETFLLINSFEPLPIIHLLKEKGFSSIVIKPEENLVQVYFSKEKFSTNLTIPENLDLLAKNDFEKKVAGYNGTLETTDVRELEMPGPMVTILEETEKLPDGGALYVDHKKIPQYLLPELASRGFRVYGYEVDENNIKLLITKDK